MSDFDVTDHYLLDWHDDLSASLRLRSGTRMTIELSALPDLRVATTFCLFLPSGELVDDIMQIWDDDATARSRMEYLVRTVINAEEPLGSPVNWSNRALVDLLVEQQRAVLCPHCLGDSDVTCSVCHGAFFVPMDVFADYFADGE
jgi:hypothetical protein